MNRSEERIINKLSEELGAELLSNIIPYWLTHSMDHENGGFYGQIDSNNVQIVDADKGSVLMARILWTFSACYKRFGSDELKDAADHAFEFIKNHCWDKSNGGVHWMVQSNGNPKDRRKFLYAQSFAIYSLSEYYSATGNREALELAKELFRIVELKCADTKNGGYHEVFDKNWNKLTDARLSEKDQNEPKSTNTHLHIMEAYTNLFRSWKSAELKDRLEALIDLFINRIVNKNQTSTFPFFNRQWEPKSSDISFGHDIETSWLLHEAANLLNDDQRLKAVELIGLNIANFVQNNGLDGDGGMFNGGDRNGVTDDRKDWWPQAEGIVGFFNAYQVSDDVTYLESADQLWEFIKEFIVDKKNGEWHEKVSRSGEPFKLDKVRSWKCPYHNTRAALEILERADSILNTQTGVAETPISEKF